MRKTGTRSIEPAAEVSPSPVKLTVVLPRETYDRMVGLALERRIQRGEAPINTTAITGEAHPLHNSGRGVR